LPFESNVDFHVVVVGPLAFEPPMRRIPSPSATTAAPDRASGRSSLSGVLSFDASVQSPSAPVVLSGARTNAVVVGAPFSSAPPRT